MLMKTVKGGAGVGGGFGVLAVNDKWSREEKNPQIRLAMIFFLFFLRAIVKVHH